VHAVTSVNGRRRLRLFIPSAALYAGGSAARGLDHATLVTSLPALPGTEEEVVAGVSMHGGLPALFDPLTQWRCTDAGAAGDGAGEVLSEGSLGRNAVVALARHALGLAARHVLAGGTAGAESQRRAVLAMLRR
jgi:hypothetical protein